MGELFSSGRWIDNKNIMDFKSFSLKKVSSSIFQDINYYILRGNFFNENECDEGTRR